MVPLAVRCTDVVAEGCINVVVEGVVVEGCIDVVELDAVSRSLLAPGWGGCFWKQRNRYILCLQCPMYMSTLAIVDPRIAAIGCPNRSCRPNGSCEVRV